jgi:hypothetical protein
VGPWNEGLANLERGDSESRPRIRWLIAPEGLSLRDQDVRCIIALADSPVLHDGQARRLERLSEDGDGPEHEPVPGDGHPSHPGGVTHPDDQPTAVPEHPSNLGEQRGEFGHKVEGVDREQGVQAAVGKWERYPRTRCSTSRPDSTIGR